MPRLYVPSLGLVLALLVVTASGLKEFDCETLEPNIEGESQSESGGIRFIVSNEDGVPTDEFTDQTGLSVSITSDEPFNAFILQARVPSDATPLGKWVVQDTKQRVYSCGVENDTLTNKGDQEIISLNARWVPLGEAVQKVTEIEFIATITTKSFKYWKNLRSTLIYLKDNAKTYKGEGEEQKMKEYEIKMIELAEEEQRTGEREVGIAMREREAEAKRQDQERIDSELRTYNLNKENQKRIMEELKDKEDYEKEQKNAIEKALRPAASSTTIAASISAISLCVFTSLLF